MSGGTVRCATWLGYIQHASIPFSYTLLFAVIGGISIASANLSLMLNSVGFYQIAKLMLAPFVCSIEFVWLRKKFSLPMLLSIAAVLMGVAVVTVTGTPDAISSYDLVPSSLYFHVASMTNQAQLLPPFSCEHSCQHPSMHAHPMPLRYWHEHSMQCEKWSQSCMSATSCFDLLP